MSASIDYEIMQLSGIEFRVVKYEHGFESQVYTVANINNSKWKCSCVSGKIRGYCKHKDWCKLIREGDADKLPSNVKLHESIDVIVAKRQVMKMLANLSKAKEKAKHEKKAQKSERAAIRS